MSGQIMNGQIMNGMCKNTGKILNEIDHLKQSIVDILTTPIGSRVMLRDYGSRLFELIDSPINDRLKIQIFAATAESLAKWETRFKCTNIAILSIENGKIEISLDGKYLPNGQEIKVSGVVL